MAMMSPAQYCGMSHFFLAGLMVAQHIDAA